MKKINCLYPGCTNMFTEHQQGDGRWKKTCGGQHANWLRTLRKERRDNTVPVVTFPINTLPNWLVYLTMIVFMLSLVSLAFSDDVRVTWDANDTSENVLGYTVHYGDSSGSYHTSRNVGLDTHFNFYLSNITYFAVSAFNANGESKLSNEIVIDNITGLMAEKVPFKYRAYPNPFTVTVNFDYYERIEIYNIIGQKLIEVKREWNSIDYASGKYICRGWLNGRDYEMFTITKL